MAVLPTGMGKSALPEWRRSWRLARYTIAQSDKSCVVYGMPSAVADLKAVRETLSPEGISRRLTELLTPLRREAQ